MDWTDNLGLALIVFIGGLLIMGLGALYAMPEELDNGCIVHDSKVYCEEVNIGEE